MREMLLQQQKATRGVQFLCSVSKYINRTREESFFSVGASRILDQNTFNPFKKGTQKLISEHSSFLLVLHQQACSLSPLFCNASDHG
jgi:hypothetical protein